MGRISDSYETAGQFHVRSTAMSAGRQALGRIVIVFWCTTALATAQVLLRSGGEPEWAEFADRTPAGKRLDHRFDAQPNKEQTTLFIRQVDVKLDWDVELNGRKLGKLFLMEYPLV